ncbi:hypothetical protein GIB67_026848 [Kingdonia uniflora]|uniref:RING-type domain-containing protein n=1 Tax=Kingdonia uniflora TaxID=39325 RepID=A0A7J7M7Q8_9MAGN|nr:hypothetical protein GIB67_026848 [Kingdonia uniflora]
MGQQQSKDELLYQQVNYGNVEGIRSLRQEGAGLEWIDKEGKTPLITACMNHALFNVAEVLIELGANVNAYRPGCHMGTPLHHAAKRGLDQTVKLLLSHGANAVVMNDDCQTPLDVARVKGYNKVVRAIESHVCLFSGWLRELYGPGILEALAPNWLSRKIWVVVIPCVSHNRAGPLKLELAIYTSLQDARPRATIALWKAKFEGPKLHQADPSLIILDTVTKTRCKLTSAIESDKHQLQQLCNAIRGVPQVMPPMVPSHAHTPAVPANVSTAEDVELAMAINASIQSALVGSSSAVIASDTSGWADTSANSSHSGWGPVGESAPSKASSSGWAGPLDKSSQNGWGPANQAAPSSEASNSGLVDPSDNSSHNGWGPVVGSTPPSKASGSGWLDEPTEDSHGGWGVSEAESTNLNWEDTPSNISGTTSIPSAPPIPEGALDGPIQYPSIDSGPVDMSVPAREDKSESSISSCVVCLDSPVEGACIPCGHMAGCMSCLNQITAKKWGCPVCRAIIDQVVRVYAV